LIASCPSNRASGAPRQFKANPFSFYAALRAEAPIYRTLLPPFSIVQVFHRFLVDAASFQPDNSAVP
jgi:hypothetical protein